jgi:MFS transporter, DHA2 family, multidrug resistance protein
VTAPAPADQQEGARRNIGDAVTSAEQLGGRAGDELLDAAHAAFTSGLRLAIIVAAAVLVATAVCALVLLPHERHVRRWHWTGLLGRPHHNPTPALMGGQS